MNATTETKPTVGEAVKGQQSGAFPIGTVDEILDRAPSDLVEEVLPIPEWECSVKVRSFTSNQSARVKSRGFGYKGEEMVVAWGEMEIIQFKEGVIEPSFTEEQVRTLHAKSGRGFQRIIDWLDEKSGMDKEELRKSRKEFQEQE